MDFIKPHVDSILKEIAMPILCSSERDFNDFHNDSVEFIRAQENLSESIYMPRLLVLEMIDAFLNHNS